MAQINIDLHILKKIVLVQEKIIEEMIKCDKSWNKLKEMQGEVKALIEFIEGEINNKGEVK